MFKLVEAQIGSECFGKPGQVGAREKEGREFCQLLENGVGIGSFLEVLSAGASASSNALADGALHQVDVAVAPKGEHLVYFQ